MKSVQLTSLIFLFAVVFGNASDWCNDNPTFTSNQAGGKVYTYQYKLTQLGSGAYAEAGFLNSAGALRTFPNGAAVASVASSAYSTTNGGSQALAASTYIAIPFDYPWADAVYSELINALQNQYPVEFYGCFSYSNPNYFIVAGVKVKKI